MKLHVVVAINHSPTAVGVELLATSHPPMPREVLLQADKNLLAEFPLEDRSPSGDLPIAQLVLGSLRPAAVTIASRASSMQTLHDVVAVAHEARLLHDRLTVLRPLP